MGFAKPNEVVLSMGDFKGYVRRRIDDFMGVHGGYGIGKRNVEGKILDFCDEKELCVANTWFEKEQNKYHTVYVEIKLRLILYWLVKTDRKYLKNVNAIL